MPTIYMMIGAPGSGKSTYAEEVLKNELNLTDESIVSSDRIREECFGDINDQTHNQGVFSILHSRVRTLFDSGKDVIIDATNMSYKDRSKTRNSLGRNYPIDVAYVMATPVTLCAYRDSDRDKQVGLYVIQRFIRKFEFPYPGEFKEVRIVHTYENGNDTCIQDRVKHCMDKFDQHNYHHKYTVGHHCDKVSEQFDVNDIRNLAGKWHDIGKCFTQTFDEDGVAHYYQHANYGAYYLLSENILNVPREVLDEVLFYVNQHMHIRDILKSDKAIKRYRSLWGEERFNKLVEFNQADNIGSGVEYHK